MTLTELVVQQYYPDSDTFFVTYRINNSGNAISNTVPRSFLISNGYSDLASQFTPTAATTTTTGTGSSMVSDGLTAATAFSTWTPIPGRIYQKYGTGEYLFWNNQYYKFTTDAAISYYRNNYNSSSDIYIASNPSPISSTVLSSTSDVLNVINATTTFTVDTVTIQAANGQTQTFTVLGSAWNSWQAVNNANVTSFSTLNTTSNPVNTVNDIANFLNANQVQTSPTLTETTVTIVAPNGQTQTFTVLGSAWNSWQAVNNARFTSTSNFNTTTSPPNTVNDISNFLNANQALNAIVVVKAVDGTTQSFTLTQSDAGVIQASQVVSNTPTSNPVTNTLNDVLNFFANHNQSSTPPPQPTPAPIVQTPIVSGNSISITYSSVGTSLLITRNGQALTNPMLSGTLTDNGLVNGTYQYSFVATINNVNSVPTTVTATVNYTAPTTQNYSYNVQVFTNSNTPPFQWFTPTNYGTNTNGQPIPAQQIVNTALGGTHPYVPNTLNALFIAQVSNADNTLALAQYLATQFSQPPVVTTSSTPRNVLAIVGGVFTGGLALSLLGNPFKKGVKKRK